MVTIAVQVLIIMHGKMARGQRAELAEDDLRSIISGLGLCGPTYYMRMLAEKGMLVTRYDEDEKRWYWCLTDRGREVVVSKRMQVPRETRRAQREAMTARGETPKKHRHGRRGKGPRTKPDPNNPPWAKKRA